LAAGVALYHEAALRLMGERAETTEAMRRQAVMLDDLGWASVASRGWGDEGAARAFGRMRELAERLDAAEARFNAMEGELTVHTMRAEYAIARQQGEEMLLLAEQVGNRMAVAAASRRSAPRCSRSARSRRRQRSASADSRSPIRGSRPCTRSPAAV
jgi:hypothetical protein